MIIGQVIYEFLHMKDALTIFGKGSFIFSFVHYGLVTKSLGARCTFEEVAKEKMSKDECDSFYNQLG
jgi:hypothetical protein